MVKSKKMSKSAIAIIVLSLLLVLSMVLGLTGAWFTQKGGTGAKTATLDFGHIDGGTADGLLSGGAVGVVKAAGSTGKAVPGDKFELGDIEIDYEANVDTFLFILVEDVKIEVKYENAEAFHVATEYEIKELFGNDVYTNRNKLVEMVQNTGTGYKAAPASGKYGNLTGDNAAVAYYLFETSAGAGYHVEFKSHEDANNEMVVLTTVANQGTNYDKDTSQPHNWSDAEVKVSYSVKAGVIQAHNITGVANNAEVATRAAAAFTALAW